jgi:peptidoglycan/xylan/chitin deacetylase (PgdA/CDA1 family)
MTWEQVRELQQAGVDFQDHSYSHFRLTERPKGLDDAAYRAWIRADLQKGAELLAKKLGHKAKIFSIPYGEYNSVVLQEIKGLGYEAIMSQDPGSISADTDPFLMPREPILGKEWSTMSHFAEVLNHLDMPLTARQPDLAPLADSRVKRFGATLLYPDRYERESLGIYVTGLGWQRAKLEGSFVFIDNDKGLSNHINRVTVSGKDKKTGRLAMRCWMVMH